ncbi:MAG: AGE family epimerase/isomerase [Anaerolineae bacterium]|nr:AGE family epimerase/isomerase [Gemmatimonadaceae bacterium]
MTKIGCKHPIRIGWLILCFIACDARSSARRIDDSPPAPTRSALAAQLRLALREKLLAPFYPRAVDRDNGGFLSEFDYQWRPTGSQDKMIVTQARHLWTNARAAQFFPGDTTFLPGASHGFRFLRDVMWDKEYGGFYWLVTRNGQVRRNENGEIIKQTYGIAFGIFALAAYFDVTRDSVALRLAQDAFHWLDKHAHDPLSGGYFRHMERDGTPLRAGYNRNPPKDMNASIHVLEAFTELYRVWPDSALRDRLDEMLALIRDTMQVPPGTLTLLFTRDWKAVSYQDSSEAVRSATRYFNDHVSFGHDVETATLMMEASEALGLQRDTATLRAAKQLVDHALHNGWDDAVGGFYDAGYYYRNKPGITIVKDTKIWWAQAEGLKTLLIFGDRYPDDPLRYHEKFLKQWSYITTYLVDHKHGGWYDFGLDTKASARRNRKAHIWKAAYHDGGALMDVIRRLKTSGKAEFVVRRDPSHAASGTANPRETSADRQ